MEQGDTIRITLNTLPRRTELCTGGWNSGFVPIAGAVVTVVDGGNDPDRLTFSVPGCADGGNFGTVTLGSGDDVGADGATFGLTTPEGSSRLSFDSATNTVVFTLGGLSAGTVATVGGATVATYTPSPLALSANLSAPVGTARTPAGGVNF